MTKETYYMHLDFNHGGHRRPRRQQLRFFRQHDRVLRESRHKIIPRTILRVSALVSLPQKLTRY